MKKYYYHIRTNGYCEHFQVFEHGQCILLWVNYDVEDTVFHGTVRGWVKYDYSDAVYAEIVHPGSKELTEQEFKRLALIKLL